MFISFDEKKKIKQDLTAIFDHIVRLDYRLSKLEQDAKTYGYRKADGKPKKLPGRPRKDAK